MYLIRERRANKRLTALKCIAFLKSANIDTHLSTHSSARWTLFEHVDPMLVALARRFYDHVFLCEPDF